MTYTLGTAAKTTGKSKTTISNAIKKGKISAKRNAHGAYEIDPAELHRVYPLTGQEDSNSGQNETPEKNTVNSALQVEVEILKQERERERQQFEETIRDLRARLDKADDERSRLTLLLTHQQEQPRQMSFRDWLFGTSRPSKTGTR